MTLQKTRNPAVHALLSEIALRNTRFVKVGPFPTSGEGLGNTFSVGSVRKC
jgi:hypothetical protein